MVQSLKYIRKCCIK